MPVCPPPGASSNSTDSLKKRRPVIYMPLLLRAKGPGIADSHSAVFCSVHDMRSVLASLPPGSRFLEDGENVRFRRRMFHARCTQMICPQIQLPENMPRIEYLSSRGMPPGFISSHQLSSQSQWWRPSTLRSPAAVRTRSPSPPPAAAACLRRVSGDCIHL